MDGIEHFAVEENSIDHQRTNPAGGAYVLPGLLQCGKDVEIVRLFDGIDLNGQGNAGAEFIDSPDLPAINRDLYSSELTSFPLTLRHDFALATHGPAALELLGGLIVCGITGQMKVFGEGSLWIPGWLRNPKNIEIERDMTTRRADHCIGRKGITGSAYSGGYGARPATTRRRLTVPMWWEPPNLSNTSRISAASGHHCPVNQHYLHCSMLFLNEL
jgi:hypothetical protein